MAVRIGQTDADALDRSGELAQLHPKLPLDICLVIVREVDAEQADVRGWAARVSAATISFRWPRTGGGQWSSTGGPLVQRQSLFEGQVGHVAPVILEGQRAAF